MITQIKARVFPRAQEEAKELFRAGQRIGGPLARQSLEPTLSYTQRRRRWWLTLIELNPSMQLSDSLRMELMLALSGLSRQEGLVVRACATSKDFEGVAKVLVEQYGQIRLREGSRSWTGRAPTSTLPGKSSGKDPGKGKYTFSSGTGSYPRSAYTAYPDGEDVDEQHWDEHWHDEPMNKLGMRMNPTLVFLVELKM